MKPALRWALGVALLLVPVVALADSDGALSVEDVLRLHFAGVSEEIIISEIIVTQTVFDLSVDEILRLKEAGISDRLLQFMVDTAIETDDGGETSADVEETESGYDDGGDVWVNEIEETEPTTNYFVSLNYSYPAWWYDSYWWDYWYWDFDYYPYRSSFVWSFGAWYPGWYSYRWCWAPAYWGYRWHWYDRYGYGGWHDHYWDYPSHYYARAYSPAHHHGPSQTKTKHGSYTPTKPLYVDAGLKVPDGTRLPVRELRLKDDTRLGKTRDGRVLLTESRPTHPEGKSPVRTPSKPGVASGLDRGSKTPDRGAVVDERRPTVRRPVRDVRAPASGGRPVKVRSIRRPSGSAEQTERPGTTPTRPAPRPSGVRKPSPDSGEKPAPTKKSTKKTEEPNRSVRQSPQPAPAPAPRVQSPPRSPAPKSSPAPSRGGSSPPPSKGKSKGKGR